MLQQIQREQDAKIADLNSTLVMIAKLIEFEQGFVATFAPPVPSSPLIALADRFMHRLNEVGQMSREELIELAVKEGFFPDADSAVQGMHPMLASLLRSELIRELANGTYEPPTMPQAIKLRKVG
jgi:hypothetical protein